MLLESSLGAELNRTENRAERLKELELILYRIVGGISVSELATRLGVSIRTIYRDIESLSCMGVPIWNQDGLYYLDRDRYLTMVRLNTNEAIALFLAARLLSKHSDEHNPYVISALKKLSEASPDDTIKEHISKAADVVSERPQNPMYIENLEKITRAWADKRCLRIQYRSSSNKLTSRVIDPYFIEPSSVGYSCYVIAYDHLRRGIRTFKIGRVIQAELLDKTYKIDPNFNLYESLKSSWDVVWGDEVIVRLKFSPQVSRRVCESHWHPSQVIEECSDGGTIMTVKIGSILEVTPWIRSWGGEVEVLEPLELREGIIEETKKLMKTYLS